MYWTAVNLKSISYTYWVQCTDIKNLSCHVERDLSPKICNDSTSRSNTYWVWTSMFPSIIIWLVSVQCSWYQDIFHPKRSKLLQPYQTLTDTCWNELNCTALNCTYLKRLSTTDINRHQNLPCCVEHDLSAKIDNELNWHST